MSRRRPGDKWAFMERKLVKQPDFRGQLVPHLYRITLFRTPWFSVKLHKILRSDTDPYLHDHPWHWFSLMLWGAYREERPAGIKVHRAGSIRIRLATSPHRLTLLTPYVWTLFITTGRLRNWGFHTPSGWVHHLKIATGDIDQLSHPS